jgi:hypothetical protein
MRILRVLVVLVATVILAGCNFAVNLSPGVKGSGKIASETRPVSGFTSVNLKGTGQLVIDTNGTESLEITADDNLLPYLTSEVQGDQLILGTKDNGNISPSKDVVYKLSAKNLNTIELSGSGDIDAKGINTDRLKAVIAGSGSLATSGTAAQQEVLVAGSGDYKGEKLKSKTANVNIMGSGDVDLDASEKLDVTIAGSGSVKYSGSPTVSQKILGSGSVDKR